MYDTSAPCSGSDSSPGRPTPTRHVRFPATGGEATQRFLALRLARGSGSRTTSLLTLPVPRVAPERLLELDPTVPAFLWDAGGDEAFAGLGTCHSLDARSSAAANRFAEIRRRAETVWRLCEPAAHPSCQAPTPRFWGGFAFERGGAGTGPWAPFGDAWFSLPRFLYRVSPEGATLTLAVRGREVAELGVRHWLQETGGLLAAFARLPRRGHRPPAAHAEPPPAGRFENEVRAARRAIRAGSLRKVVVAHAARVTSEEPLTPSRLLARLPRDGGLTRFAFRRQGSSFLGATPERLIARCGSRIESEALAGSAAPGVEEARRLMASAKERHEHELVVGALRERLQTLCRALSVPDVPGIRVLPGLQHLATPIHGTLARSRHVLDLAAELHPTPAVAGLPAVAAREWIHRHEAAPRGWYAGPVGFFDAAGDGDFSVALRSCLTAGDETFVYAGAGIVADSDPAHEYRETTLKMRTLLAALGVPAGTSLPAELAAA